jgi:hypothetical protein
MDWKHTCIVLHVIDNCGLRLLAKITCKSRNAIRHLLITSGCYQPGNDSRPRIQPIAKPRVIKTKRQAKPKAKLDPVISRARSLSYYHNNKREIYQSIKSDPNRYLRMTCRSRISKALRHQHQRKSRGTTELLGCTIQQLKAHLQSQFKPGMSWSNYGLWHIDHIKPCALFNLSIDSERMACFHYSNLQPLWATDNLSKSDTFTLTRHNSNASGCEASPPIRYSSHNTIGFWKESSKSPFIKLVPKQAGSHA